MALTPGPEFPAIYSDAGAARAYLEALRWPDGVVCAHCGLVSSAWRIRALEKLGKGARAGLWKCAGCERQFTVSVGTILENTKLPPEKWVLAIHCICQERRGLSYRQLQGILQISYKSARALGQRVRKSQGQEPLLSVWREEARKRAVKLALETKPNRLELNRVREILHAGPTSPKPSLAIRSNSQTRHQSVPLSLWPIEPDSAVRALLRVDPYPMPDS